jgi:hypothetical protein
VKATSETKNQNLNKSKPIPLHRRPSHVIFQTSVKTSSKVSVKVLILPIKAIPRITQLIKEHLPKKTQSYLEISQIRQGFLELDN